MNSFISDLEKKLNLAFQKSFNQHLPQAIKWEHPPKIEYGHLAVSAFIYAKELKKNPDLIAEQWFKNLEAAQGVAKSTLQGSYINFFFDFKQLASYLFKQAEQNGLIEKVKEPKKILIEYSSPNANKPLHLGHARNNSIGVFLTRLANLLGHKTIAVNLINDRGIHICKSMLAYCLSDHKLTPAAKKGDHLVGDYYVEYNKMEGSDPKMADQAQAMLKKWEDGDKEVRSLWRKLTDWVLAGLLETYNRCGVEFDKFYYESEIYKGGKEIIKKALNDGILSTEENGAIAIDLSEFGLDKKILQRSDGTSLYITQDINLSLIKYQDYKFDLALWVVGSEQDYNFKVLKAILSKLKYQWSENCEHVSYGMIELTTGKMKSREGTTVDIDNLLDEMKFKAKELLLNKNDESEYKKNELDIISESVGQAAVNYFILRSSSSKKIVFEKEESLNFDGATGPYLQYCLTRINSLLKKSGQSEINKIESRYNWNAEEQQLILQLFNLNEVLIDTWQTKNPANVANFCYNLARDFNRFYQNVNVLTADEETKANRINLIYLVQRELRYCFYLMNIQELERM